VGLLWTPGEYLSGIGIGTCQEQNKEAPVANYKFMQAFREAIGPDVNSPLWAPFDQGHPDGIAAGHLGMPRTYFQVCGMDMNRDDGLIYERVLREECRVPTRVDVYSGFPHCLVGYVPGAGGIQEEDGGYG